MFDERKKRSDVREEALQYLIEAVLDRSDVVCAAIVDADARLLAGAGSAGDLRSVARVANDVVRGDASGVPERGDGMDVLACRVEVNGETLIIAAIGTRIRRLPGAAKAVARICGSTSAASW